MPSLDETFDALWAHLEEAATTRGHAMRWVTLATIGDDGSPQARTVILRSVDPQRRRIAIHTDSASAKVAEIGRDGRVTVCAYDPGPEIQIRLSGHARVLDSGETVNAAWANTPPPTRRAYTISPDPATAIGAPGEAVRLEDGEPGRARFRVVEITARRIDWLQLGRDGHTRALFTLDPDSASWIVP